MYMIVYMTSISYVNVAAEVGETEAEEIEFKMLGLTP